MSPRNAVVAVVPSVGEAHIVVGLLAANGVDAAVSSDDMGGADPQLQLTQGVRVLVADENAELAAQIIAGASRDAGA